MKATTHIGRAIEALTEVLNSPTGDWIPIIASARMDLLAIDMNDIRRWQIDSLCDECGEPADVFGECGRPLCARHATQEDEAARCEEEGCDVAW